jgi:hypothetical protein
MMSALGSKAEVPPKPNDIAFWTHCQTLAAAPTAFPRKKDQERIGQSESEDSVEQVEQKRELSTKRRTGPEKSKGLRVGE